MFATMIRPRQLAVGFARHFFGKGYATAHRLGLFDPGSAAIHYLSEKADWSIRQDALAYSRAVNALHPGLMTVSDRPERATSRIAHFGSQFIWQAWARAMDPGTRCLVTFFHGKPEDGPTMADNVAFLLNNLNRLERVVTAASKIERRLLGWGVPQGKIVRVPLGIDIERFLPATPEQRRLARGAFAVPDGRICVGSFQKDGEGWGEGMAPKLIKGPDIFTDAVIRLAKDFPIFVLLTGPARGYVKSRLEAAGIPYAHRNFDSAHMVVQAFHALDLYLVASREEGGPKAVLESLATGVPLVSTRVGMAEDVITDGQNGFLVDEPEAALLADRAGVLLSQPDLARRLVARGLQDVRAFSWQIAGGLLYERAYCHLLERRS